MFHIILTALYYALPGMVANMFPLFGRNMLGPMAKPVDFGLKLRGKRLFGENKTIRGFVLGISGGVLTGFFQFLLRDVHFFSSISYVDYTLANSIIIGAVFGFAALFGDAVESVMKRQTGIAPGKPFIPFDQLDYVLGIILFSFLLKPMTWQMMLALVIFGFLFHIAVTRIGFILKIRKEKW